jgi:hypothetical protein
MTHPMDMSLSVTGWAVDPTLLADARFELLHSDTTGDCFLIKLRFTNGTDATLSIEMKDGSRFDAYDALTEAIRCRRLPSSISGSAEPS